MILLTVADLEKFLPDIGEETLQAWIDHATDLAVFHAPCLRGDDPEPHLVAAARAIVRAAIIRWGEISPGPRARIHENAGPFGYQIDPKDPDKGAFWPSEINELKQLCQVSKGKVFTLKPKIGGDRHGCICSLRFGADWCSCGSDINAGRGPIFEQC